ncbi:MAG: peptide ABC transporter substrate-binding protein [Clostridia bacterium]|nr:peptide ABC transporter substrate-binding protein [Clostridia bacterium]
MKKAIAILLILISILTIFTSCDEETSSDLYYPVTEDFGTIDPQVASVSSSKMIAYNCFEGLVRLNENKEIVAAGADSWSVSNDSLVYTFNLRKDAKWYLTNTSKEELSDEDKDESLLPENFDNRVTAYDYAFGLKRALDPATGSAEGKYLSSIKNGSGVQSGALTTDALGIEVLDDYTLKITLDYPDPNFLYYLTRLAAMPCNETFFNACRGRYGLAMEYMLCNGEYMVYRWTQGAVIRLEKNPLYTGSEPAKNDRVWVYYVEDGATVPEKIEKGTYDAGYVSADSLSLFNDDFTVSALSDVIWGYWFNCAADTFTTTALRKAFAASADLSLLTAPDYIEGTTNRLLTNTLSPYYDFTPELISYNENTALAHYKTAMNENENISASMSVTVLTTEDFADCVKKQIQIWQRVFGIDVKINIQSRDEALKLFNSGNYQIAFLPVTVTASNTAEFLGTFKSGSSYNITGYANEFYDNLIDSLTNTMTDEQKNDIFKKCEQTVISDAVIIPVYTEASYFILGKNVSGIYSFSESEIYFRNGNILS